ncbi:MAG: sodium:alanine symporter family protein [Acidobacteria bacterium]|nr:sodium:alanine symporter family protein [Acidobacteriota bacterium]
MEIDRTILNIVQKASEYVWGAPMLVLLVGTGIFLTIRLRGLQFHGLFHSLYLAFIKRREDEASEGDITHFQALMTALSATVGTGNIAGVAIAIAVGGPGALFWMWITGLFGMATKYAEAVLAVKYREQDNSGSMRGGPMYYISKGLGWRWLAVVFAVLASVAAFGIGNMVQSNSVAEAVSATFHIEPWISGLFLAVITGCVIIGGIKTIGRVTSVLVPVMIVFYILAAVVVLIINFRSIPETVGLVFTHAFTATAATGGFLGAFVKDTIRLGVSRGVFSNESGLGSAPIAAAAAQTKNPVTQALVSMTQTFIDTIVVCTLTGFVILTTGVWNSGATGAELTTMAFNTGLKGSIGEIIVAVGLILFAYSTMLGWCYYGEKSLEYLFGSKLIRPYRFAFCLAVFVGAYTKLDLVWAVADVFNGLMAVPNLIALLALSGVVVAETKRFYKRR